MGIYTSSNHFGVAHDYAAEIPANEAYNAAFGCAQILSDCQANDMAIFESAIYDDMNEVMSIQEGYGYVNENAFTDVIKKIIEMFKKLIAKIKGIFSAFIAKLNGLFKNGHDLVKKYEKQIIKYSNWKKFKISGIRRPKNNGTSIIDKIDEVFKISSGAFQANIDRYKITESDTKDNWTCNIPKADSKAEDVQKADAEDIREALLKIYIKDGFKPDYKDFSKDVFDEIYDDEEKIDGDDDNISSSFFTSEWIKGVLDDKKLISNAEKLNKKINDNINKIIESLDKTHSNLASLISKNGKDATYTKQNMTFGAETITKDSSLNKKEYDFTASDDTTPTEDKRKASDIQPIIQALQKIASNEQEVVTKTTSEYMNQLKFAMGQARKLWTAAAAYTSTEHKEDASYYQAVGECAMEQSYQVFESIH